MGELMILQATGKIAAKNCVRSSLAQMQIKMDKLKN